MSIQQLLEEIARRGSWFGGGSVAALGAAASAALLEKLVGQGGARRRLRRIRQHAARLIEQDATLFARVIDATRPARGRGRRFQAALEAATALQLTVWRSAQQVQRIGRAQRRAIAPRFQSDLRCALALAKASAASAKVLIRTNLTWLNEFNARGARQGEIPSRSHKRQPRASSRDRMQRRLRQFAS